MSRVISKNLVPVGFETTTHSIFFNYQPPQFSMPQQIAQDLTNVFIPPVTVNQEDSQICDHNTTCAICLSTMNYPITLICKHSFCNDCIMSWFHINNTCPVCKGDGKYIVKSVSNTPEANIKLYRVDIHTMTCYHHRNSIASMEIQHLHINDAMSHHQQIIDQINQRRENPSPAPII